MIDKWEYCAVGPLRAYLEPVRKESYCEIWYLTDTGIQVPTALNLPYYHPDVYQNVAQLIWLLGEEGWELVTSGAGVVELTTETTALEVGGESLKKEETGHTLYFKRRKQENNA